MIARRILAALLISGLLAPAVALAEQKPTASRPTFADIPVVTQDGEELMFYTDLVKDRVVAVNFLFTSCTTIRPLMGANFAGLQKRWLDRVGTDFLMISVRKFSTRPRMKMIQL